jgi:hypothetical protein
MNGGRRTGIFLLVIGIAVAISAGVASAKIDSGPWVELESGTIGGFSWSVGANRAAAGASDATVERPCLRVGAVWRVGPLSYLRRRSRACAMAPGRPKPTQAPLTATASQPSSGTPSKMSAVGMLVPAAVKRLEVTFADGSTRSMRLHALSPSQARATSLPGYRYAAFVVHGPWCAERIVTLGTGGRTLSDSGLDEFSCG